MHGYVVPSRIGTCLYHPTIRIQRLFRKKNHVKRKYVKNLELINKD